jgi:hypothetical protein
MAPVIAAYLYPWDVVGDPAAPERLRAMGIREVTLAAVYHATRAITPRHPRHRIVVADHTAAYIPLAPDRWRDAAIVLPAVDDTFITAAQALRDHDMSVHAWVVRRRPREAHDKVWLPRASGSAPAELPYRLSLCFCDRCAAAYSEAGLDVDRLRHDVRSSVDAGLRGEPLTDRLDPRIDRTQHTIADRLRRTMVDRIRVARPDWRVAVHGSPDHRSTLAFIGLDLEGDRHLADLVVAPCWSDHQSVAPLAAAGFAVHANLLAVGGLRGRNRLADIAVAAADAGASGLRFFHAGLASDRDLTAMAAAIGAVGGRLDRPAE